LKLHLQNSELAMPVIRISQQTWERLKTYATPLEDTADDVVNVALDALEAARRKGRRIARSPRRCRKENLISRSAVNEPL
jgi:hypothetical protein